MYNVFPHSLTDKKKECRLKTCKEFSTPVTAIHTSITGSKFGAFLYNPETRCQSTEWETKSSPRPKACCLQKSMMKTMLIFLFHKQGVICQKKKKKLVPDGKIVNSEFYIQILETLLKGISRVRPQF